MLDIITIGSSLVDIFIHSPEFLARKGKDGDELCQAFGDKIELDGFKIFSGGGASNTAVGFSRLGLNTAVISEMGRDNFCNIVLSEFEDEGVDSHLLIKEKKEQTGGSVIMVGENGRRIIMVNRGAASMLDPFDIPGFWLLKTKWVHLSSIGGREKTLEKIFSLISRRNEAGLSWNPGKAELQLLVKERLDISSLPVKILIMNLEEWEIIQKVQEQILSRVPEVIITNGREGGRLFLNGQAKFSYEAGSKPVETTGAGDAFSCGYVAARNNGIDPEKAIEWGVRNASSVVKFYGAKTGLLRKEQIDL
jgi:ribokinase